MAFLEIFIAAIAAFLLGMVWYTALFGKVWQQESGVSDESAQSNMLMTHSLSFLMMLIIAFAINFVVNLHTVEEQTFVHGGFHGALSALIFAIPLVAINYLYQRRSLKMFLIDATYALLFFSLMGAILAALKLG